MITGDSASGSWDIGHCQICWTDEFGHTFDAVKEPLKDVRAAGKTSRFAADFFHK